MTRPGTRRLSTPSATVLGAGDFASDLLAFASTLRVVPGNTTLATSWGSENVQPCVLDGINCNLDGPGTFAIILPGNGLAGRSRNAPASSQCSSHEAPPAAGSLAASWATLPSFQASLTRLNVCTLLLLHAPSALLTSACAADRQPTDRLAPRRMGRPLQGAAHPGLHQRRPHRVLASRLVCWTGRQPDAACSGRQPAHGACGLACVQPAAACRGAVR